MRKPRGFQSATPCIDGAVETRMEVQSMLRDAAHLLASAYATLVSQNEVLEAAKREIAELRRQAA